MDALSPVSRAQTALPALSRGPAKDQTREV